MRRWTNDEPGRLPAPRAVLVPRSRFTPLALALPLVAGLWLTIGLPIFAELSSAGGGGGSSRDVLFQAGASGGFGGSGSGGGPRGSAPTIAVAVVDPKFVQEVRGERVPVVVRASPGGARAGGAKTARSEAIPIAALVHVPSSNENPSPFSVPPPPPPPPAPAPVS
jgi:hypothetical protein